MNLLTDPPPLHFNENKSNIKKYFFSVELLCTYQSKWSTPGLNIFLIVESLQSHFILTMSHWSSGLPVCFPPQGTRVQIPWGVIVWNRDSLVSIASLHWILMWLIIVGSSQTVTRPSCWQCDNPTRSRTAFLSLFNARCRSPLWLHNRQSLLLRGSPVESLQSHFILTMSHWSSGLPVCFPPQGTRVQIP
jgi:hypothetical protein